MKKTIITRPFHKNGGVAEFVKNIAPSAEDSCMYFFRGKRKANSKWNFALPILDIFRFIIFVSKTAANKIFVNSSLSLVGIIRDGFYVRFSKFLGKKTILFIHGFDEKALKYKLLIKWGYFKADKIFVLSNDFNIHLKKLGFQGEIIESFNPISKDIFLNAPKRDFSGDKPLKILMISRIEESKGIFIALEAIRNLPKHKTELHIAGTGTMLNRAKTFRDDNNMKNVFFHGFVSGDEKIELLKSTDILLFPTYHNEGLPINILESLAMGLYVITRPVAGIKDLSKHYSMKLTESLDPNEYQKIILQLLHQGLPESSINSNQTKAFIDFNPSFIFKNVVKDS